MAGLIYDILQAILLFGYILSEEKKLVGKLNYEMVWKLWLPCGIFSDKTILFTNFSFGNGLGV